MVSGSVLHCFRGRVVLRFRITSTDLETDWERDERYRERSRVESRVDADFLIVTFVPGCSVLTQFLKNQYLLRKVGSVSAVKVLCT